ncbi:MAG: hypothetical protein OXG02_10985 [Chloroflexi bacterium]|nr:hypothetical protein [Chloroflexota bacterium]
MNPSARLISLSAIPFAAVAILVGWLAFDPPRPLIAYVRFSQDTLSANADGWEDVVEISYELTKNARITLQFIAESGQVYPFRDDVARAKGEYALYFSGVVQAASASQPKAVGEVLRHTLPDGRYEWVFSASANDSSSEDEAQQQLNGFIELQDGDSVMPDIVEFSVSPQEFTPNQDGRDDRVQINLYLTKDAQLEVYLEAEDGSRIFVPERQEGRAPGEAGRAIFDYEGGVDIGADPPADGEYTVTATARDAVGQVIQRRAQLSIRAGGKPRAEISGQPSGVTVVFDHIPYEEAYYSANQQGGEAIAPPEHPNSLSLTTLAMPLGDVLVFRLTVENYGRTPIRTAGPWPGTVYEQNQRAASLGWYEEAGAWRVGLDCDTAASDYPWRWAVAPKEHLVAETDERTGITYYYLPPGESAVVWGGVHMTELVDRQNPQTCYAGLIHEQVAITIENQRVGPREIELIDADAPLYPDDSDSE